jgi:hypothetical protein
MLISKRWCGPATTVTDDQEFCQRHLGTPGIECPEEVPKTDSVGTLANSNGHTLDRALG